MERLFFKFLLGGLGCAGVTFVVTAWATALIALPDLPFESILVGLALSATFTVIGGFGLLCCVVSRDQKR